jgi:hypothetical protein
MKQARTTKFLQSFTFNIGTSKGQDNWVPVGPGQPNYIVPIEMLAGDCPFLVGLFVSTAIVASNAITNFDLVDAGGNSISSMAGGATLASSTTTGTYYTFPFLFTAGLPEQVNYLPIIKSGFLQVVITGIGSFTAGIGRFDIGYIRQS